MLAVVQDAALSVNRYPDTSASDLRARIALANGVSVEEVAVGPGSVGVLQQILAALCEPGDEVVFAWRSFEAYPILATVAGAVPVHVPLTAAEGHDFAAMAAAVTGRTRVVIVCSPNNPTGVSVAEDELRTFIDEIPDHVLVVIDEAYVEYSTPGGVDSMAFFRDHSNVAVLRTFSKAYGLAGLRVGYAIAHVPVADGLRRTALPFGVSALAQLAAIASLNASVDMRVRVSQVVGERQRVRGLLVSAGWTIPESEANFLWIRAKDELRDAILRKLSDEGILVRGYPRDGVRITLADPATNDRVVEALGARRTFGGDR